MLQFLHMDIDADSTSSDEFSEGYDNDSDI